MTKSKETGHARNLAHFESLIAFCTAYGGDYNPAKPALTVSGLQEIHLRAKNALAAVHNARTTYDLAVNARQDAFKGLKALATRITNALEASGASESTMVNAKAINKKLQGGGSAARSAPADPADPAATTRSISTSQLGYDNLIEHFAKYIELLLQEPIYKPNEEDLKIAGLQQKMAELQAVNTALIQAYTTLSNARLQRDHIILDPVIGLVQIASEVKKYVKSLFGATSPQAKQITVLEFKTRKE
ncbi:MAG TPA: hypothetical protein VL098_09810 [Flavipsychrobacter sp.]|nr:hypothetical protein [Flavipsychrobacter sp.]